MKQQNKNGENDDIKDIKKLLVDKDALKDQVKDER